mmetsp:Transcript_24160/g.80319  ORF Transcript_24160/g.80319 Transcript_24160/m.80319 type:complete len:254 (-) Transcript_24160:301-1062(-)
MARIALESLQPRNPGARGVEGARVRARKAMGAGLKPWTAIDAAGLVDMHVALSAPPRPLVEPIGEVDGAGGGERRRPVLVCHVLGRAQVQYEGRKQGMARRSRHKRVGDGLRPASHTCRIGAGANVTPAAAVEQKVLLLEVAKGGHAVGERQRLERAEAMHVQVNVHAAEEVEVKVAGGINALDMRVVPVVSGEEGGKECLNEAPISVVGPEEEGPICGKHASTPCAPTRVIWQQWTTRLPRLVQRRRHDEAM